MSTAALLSMLGTFIGGLGLFLTGIHLLTEGLKLAAGSALKAILKASTRSTLRGVLAGALITAMVQSSSAVTVATLGFVNAGLLDLGKALTVIYGSNVGTTVIGWIVSLTGLDMNLTTLALPIVGAGTLLQLSGPKTRRGAIGGACSGTGLVLMGLSFLSSAFGEVGKSIDLSQVPSAGPASTLLFVLVGVLVTTLVQSSAATLALTLTAASGGLIPMASAAALVIGANLGTTSTAVLAAMGATSSAKRVAAGHVAFNILAASIALLFLPLMLLLVSLLSEELHLGGGAAVSLALFHTVFNVVGVVVILPFNRRLVHFLLQRFRTVEEEEGTPRYLDKTVLAVPHVAVQAALRELRRAGAQANALGLAALAQRDPDPERLERRHSAFEALMRAISGYVAQVDRISLPEDVALQMPDILRSAQQYVTAVDLAMSIAQGRQHLTETIHEPVASILEGFRATARSAVESANTREKGYSAEGALERLGELEERYRTSRDALTQASARGDVEAIVMAEVVTQMAEVRQMVRRLVKAGVRLAPMDNGPLASPVSREARPDVP